MNQPPPPYPQQPGPQQPGPQQPGPQQPGPQFAPYPGSTGGPGWQGGPPPPAPKGGRTGLVIGLSAALAIALIALVVVLLTHGGGGDDNGGGGTASPGGGGGTHGTGGGATAAPARPSAQPQQQQPPDTDYERVAFAYVSAVQNNDLATAQSLTCSSFRPQARVAPLGLRSPTGVVVNKIDTFQLGGADAITDSDPADTGPGSLIKAKVGIRVMDGGNGVHWIFDVRPDHGQAKICGQSVLDLSDIVPPVD